MVEEEEDRQRPEAEEVDSPLVEGVDDCCYLLSSVDSIVLVPQVERLEWQFYKLVYRLVLP